MSERIIPRRIDIYDEMPDGWAVLKGAGCAPKGYEFIWNRKSRFGGEYKHGLLKEKNHWDNKQTATNTVKEQGGNTVEL